MPNKLRDIFSADIPNLGGSLSFRDSEAYKKFLEALGKTENEGCPVEIEGVTSFSTGFEKGEKRYLLMEGIRVDHVVISPEKNDAPVIVKTKYGERKVPFRRYYTRNEIILETNEKEIIYYKIAYERNTEKKTFTFTYRIQPQNAVTIKDVVESFSVALALLDKIFHGKDNQASPEERATVDDMKKTFSSLKKYFDKLCWAEKKFGVSFSTAEIKDDESSQVALEELYMLFNKKAAIRLNAKLSSIKSTKMIMKENARKIEIGSNIDLTFFREAEYTINGQKIIIYTANLLSNAVVKKNIDGKDGATKILYGDTDNCPMYISYTGFQTIDEARREMEAIMEHKKKYVDALTLDKLTHF